MNAVADAAAATPPAGDTPQLGRALTRGLGWVALLRWGAQGVSWLGTLAVIRALSPADYGAAGMALAYLNLVRMVADVGFGGALVALPALDEREARGAQSLSTLIGVTASLLSLGLAGPIAAFFGDPGVVRLIRIIALVPLVESLTLVPAALLSRQLRYRAGAVAEAVRTIVGIGLSVALALAGMGALCIILGHLAGAAAFALVVASVQRPAFGPIGGVGRRIVGFGGDLLVSRFAYMTYVTAPSVVAGRMGGSAVLGVYNVALTFAALPAEKLTQVLAVVAPPIFARAAQQGGAELGKFYLGLTRALSLVLVPLLWGLAATAVDAVPVLAGPRWHEAIPVVVILALHQSVSSAMFLAAHAVVASGDARSARNQSLLAVGVLVPLFVLGASRWGAIGLAAAWLVAQPLLQLRLVGMALRHAGRTAGDYLRAVAPAYVGSLVMVGAVLGLRLLPWGTGAAVPALRLAADVVIGAATYASVLRFGFGVRPKDVLAALH
ncbi:MAG: oligosaccharide flippase family protein [Gemmatimonadales bacterium]|nr:oligosaccharide flippase family protein [Gemmatimonadales bacterium]